MANISSAKLKKSLNAFKTEAKNKGYESHFLFLSTLKRLEVQINILDQMEQSMEEEGMLVTKEYVKGRENIYTNPAVNAYNKTCQQANNTTQTLMKIIEQLRNMEDSMEDDEL